VVTPAEAAVQKWLFFLNSGFRRNDRKHHFLTFYGTVIIEFDLFLYILHNFSKSFLQFLAWFF